MYMRVFVCRAFFFKGKQCLMNESVRGKKLQEGHFFREIEKPVTLIPVPSTSSGKYPLARYFLNRITTGSKCKITRLINCSRIRSQEITMNNVHLARSWRETQRRSKFKKELTKYEKGKKRRRQWNELYIPEPACRKTILHRW